MKILFRSLMLLRVCAAGLLALMCCALPAAAQGKRLGLVIGFSDYGETKHPTALPDAGLVSQSLKQAGFEVSDAANLPQGEFRTLFRDFIEKASAAGPDSVIAVYISGFGLQDDGENIILPMEARLRQRADLGIEGLRVSDYLRALSVVPARQKIVMLDAAYQHPHLALVADGGRGFALVEKQDGLLLGMNQSPGQAAPLPRTQYGAYAMAVAEAVREPGLTLDAMFERVRLRVHDLSQGTQTPWHVSGISNAAVLNAPVAGAPVATTQETTNLALRQKPLDALTPDEAYARAIEIDTIAAYESVLKLHPTHPQAKKLRAMIASRREAAYWQKTRKANTDRAYWTYLKHYPKGSHAGEAYNRLDRLAARAVPPQDFAEILYDDLPPPLPVELEVFEYVVVEEHWESVSAPYATPYGFLPPPPIDIIELPPPPPYAYGQRVLPAVMIGAGVVGAAILANRAWRRPPDVRPAFAPPPTRPPVAPGFRPGMNPRAIGVAPPPGAIRPTGVPQPGSLRPGAIPQPGVPVPGAPRPGAPRLDTPRNGPPPVALTPPTAPAAPGLRNGQPPLSSVANPVRPVPPKVTAPPVARPQAPVIARPSVPTTRAPSYRPPPPGYRPPMPNYRPGPPIGRQTVTSPPIGRQAAPAMRQPAYRPPAQTYRAAPPMMRPAPPPVARQAPPAMRAPPPMMRPQAPAPAARQQPARPVQCTPQLRAQRIC